MVGMEELTQILIEYGGVTGVIAVAALVALSLVVKVKGFALFGATKPSVDASDVQKSLAAVNRRLDRIEVDLEQRPTRDDFFSLKLSFTKQDEQLKAVLAGSEATRHAVNRMEQYMIDYAMKGKG